MPPKHPWFKFFAADWIGSQRLKFCSLAAHGLLVNLMCLAHDSEPYGCILLKQKYNQTGNQIEGFAAQLARVLPFNEDTIRLGLEDLVAEGIVQVADGRMEFGKMVAAHDLSTKRAKVGSLGGRATQHRSAAPTKQPDAAPNETTHAHDNYGRGQEVYDIGDIGLKNAATVAAWERWLAVRYAKTNEALDLVRQEAQLRDFSRFCNANDIGDDDRLEFFAAVCVKATAGGFVNLNPQAVFNERRGAMRGGKGSPVAGKSYRADAVGRMGEVQV